VPEHGKDAKIDYKFETDVSRVKYTEDETGTINYKEKNIVQNVVAGQVLAVKIPPTMGVPARTVTNEKIEVHHGEDVPLEVGKGAKVSDDKLQIISTIAGQAVL